MKERKVETSDERFYRESIPDYRGEHGATLTDDECRAGLDNDVAAYIEDLKKDEQFAGLSADKLLFLGRALTFLYYDEFRTAVRALSKEVQS